MWKGASSELSNHQGKTYGLYYALVAFIMSDHKKGFIHYKFNHILKGGEEKTCKRNSKPTV